MAFRFYFSTALLFGLGPLAAAAQQGLEETHPPVYYHVGLQRAPLLSSPDTLHQRPTRYLPSQTLVHVVGELSPRWVVVKEHGFLYLTPAAALADYDPTDAITPPLDATTHRITYQDVVQVPNVSAAELLLRARAWLGQAYNQQNATVLHDDPAAGLLEVQGTQLVHAYLDYQGVPRASYAGVVRHKLSIYVKDGRYKYVLTDFVHDAQHTAGMKSGGPLEQKKATLYGYAGLGSYQNWAELKTEGLRNARHLLDSLEAAMTQQPMRRTRNPRDF